jgi:hypothetical protein
LTRNCSERVGGAHGANNAAERRLRKWTNQLDLKHALGVRVRERAIRISTRAGENTVNTSTRERSAAKIADNPFKGGRGH